jgi:hypothetical protein
MGAHAKAGGWGPTAYDSLLAGSTIGGFQVGGPGGGKACHPPHIHGGSKEQGSSWSSARPRRPMIRRTIHNVGYAAWGYCILYASHEVWLLSRVPWIWAMNLSRWDCHWNIFGTTNAKFLSPVLNIGTRYWKNEHLIHVNSLKNGLKLFFHITF